MTRDEMVRWHHKLDGHEFEQGLVVGDGEVSKPGMLAAVHGVTKCRTSRT